MIRTEEIVNTQQPRDMDTEINEATSDFVEQLTHLPLPALSKQITEFNKMYDMPTNTSATTTPGFDPLERMKSFKKILLKEVDEIDEIIEAIAVNQSDISLRAGFEPTNWMTMLADLLGDIIVYARSEGEKYGLPMDNVLNIIMESNFSKMGADGKPIYDADGKLEKGPNYWKPEPRIKAMLAAHALVVDQFAGIETSSAKMDASIDAIKSGSLEMATYGVKKSDDATRERIANELRQIMGLTRMITRVVGGGKKQDTEETGVAGTAVEQKE